MKYFYLLILILFNLGCKNEIQKDKINNLFIIAENKFYSNQNYEAIRYYNLFLKNSSSKNDSLIFKASCRLATCFLLINDQNRYKETWKKIDSIYKSNNNFKKFSYDYYYTFARFELYNNNFSNALQLFIKSKRLLLPSDTLISYIDYKIGNCFEKQKQLDSAENYYRKALAGSRQKEDKFSNELAMRYNAMAYIYLIKYANTYTAKLYYDSVLYISNSCRYLDSSVYAWNLQNIGGFYHYLGFYAKAQKFYSDASEIYSKLKNYQDEVNLISISQANVYCYFDQFDLAQNLIDKAISYYSEKDDPGHLQKAFIEKAYDYFIAKEYRASLNYFQKALLINDKFYIKSDVSILNNLAWCYIKLNKLDSAEILFKKCIVLNKSETNYNLNDLITLYGEYSRMLIMEKHYKKALDVIDNKLPTLFKNFGKKNTQYGYFIYWRALAYDSLNLLPASLDTYNKVIEASIIPEIKTDIYEVPVFKVTDVLSDDNIIDALTGKATILNKLSLRTNDLSMKIFLLQKSQEHYEKANELVEVHNKQMGSENDRLKFTGFKTSINENVLTTALQLYRFTKNQKYLEKAFTAADHGKATQVTLGLKEDEYKRLGGVPDSLIQKEKDLLEEISLMQGTLNEEKNKNNSGKRTIDQLNNKLNTCMSKSEMLGKEMENNYPRYYQLKFAGMGVDIDKLKQLAGPQKNLVEYSFTTDSLYTFALSGNGLNIVSQSLIGIEDSLVQFRDILANVTDSAFTLNSIKRYAKLSFWLYKKLLEPIEPVVKEKELVIIPDGLLNLLPFEALITSGSIPKKADYGVLPYLLYKHTISYAYSSELFILQQKSKANVTSKVIAFAPYYNNVVYKPVSSANNNTDTIQLTPLTGSREESNSIVKTFGGHSITGEDATKSKFRKLASEGNILHLAMHTIINNEFPMSSKLVFAPTNDTNSNAFLNTYEIYNLNMRSPLVVLSACNTGNGKMLKGEGMISLARGFVYAGCPSMVITLWNVVDRSSSDLMQDFYKNLRNKEHVDKSLRQAKINYISNSDQRQSHPHFWAAYIQTGKTLPVYKEQVTSFYHIVAGIFILLFISGITVMYFRKKTA
jgi:CHAT domain-containing protein/tetratricopeptide (TPR) repeat protein